MTSSSASMDDSKHLGSAELAVNGEIEAHIDPQEESKLLAKLDAVLLSTLGSLYLLSFLDRSNLGNANIAGLSKDLGLKGNQFGAAASVLYATYVVFEPVWANLLKMVGARRLMTISTMLWGAITIGTAFVKNYEQLIACRVLLGAAEAGLFPCVNLYLAMSYRPEELGRRISYVFCAAALSGAFGGLLAFGLVQIKGGPLLSWQYLYLVEGIISFLAAPMVWFVLPDTLDKAWWLTSRERELCLTRYQLNKRNFDPEETFSWHVFFAAVKDWKTWSSAVNQFCVDVTLYAFTTFVPGIVKGLEITKDTVYVQLLTVPVYVVAAGAYVVSARWSDSHKNRSIPIALSSAVGVVGYGILIGADSVKVRFFGVFVLACSLYCGVGSNVTWLNNLQAPHYRRSTSIGMMQLVGNSSGATVGFMFNAQTGPRYLKGMYIAMSLLCLSVVITICQAMALKRLNRINASKVAAGAPDQPELGSDNPHFVYML